MTVAELRMAGFLISKIFATDIILTFSKINIPFVSFSKLLTIYLHHHVHTEVQVAGDKKRSLLG